MKRYYKMMVPSGHYTAISFEETSPVPAIVSNCKFTKEWRFLLGDRVAEWKRLMTIENKPTRVPRKQNKDEQILIDLKDDIDNMKDSEKNVSQETKKRNQKPITQKKPQETARNKRRKNDLEDDSLGSDYSMEHESDSNSDYSFNGEPMGDRDFTEEKFKKLMEKKVYLPVVPKELRP